MKNTTVKKIIAGLANAPKITAEKLITEATSPEEREELKRVFKAVGIAPTEKN